MKPAEKLLLVLTGLVLGAVSSFAFASLGEQGAVWLSRDIAGVIS